LLLSWVDEENCLIDEVLVAWRGRNPSLDISHALHPCNVPPNNLTSLCQPVTDKNLICPYSLLSTISKQTPTLYIQIQKYDVMIRNG
jgi:hypothetical protein